jgi:hypothetical protein
LKVERAEIVYLNEIILKNDKIMKNVKLFSKIPCAAELCRKVAITVLCVTFIV